jgi:hypothetical protein
VLAQVSVPISLDHDMAVGATYAHDGNNDMVRGLATAGPPQPCATTASWRSERRVMVTEDAMQTTYVVQRLGWHRRLLLWPPPLTSFRSPGHRLWLMSRTEPAYRVVLWRELVGNYTVPNSLYHHPSRLIHTS